MPVLPPHPQIRERHPRRLLVAENLKPRQDIHLRQARQPSLPVGNLQEEVTA